ncbi:large conductance mechanosensitive channel protein MscL [Eubacteriaceae bacterium ES3]|nr:large conductance mechanosensitive channel protein MscL [Eubacteriaceae bacterium ES3]
MKKFFDEFKSFLLKGNVIDLSIAVIIGAAFQAIVTSFTSDIISPVLGIFAKNDFSNLVWSVAGVEIRYGAFLTAVINFVIMAFVIFLMLKLVKRLKGLKKEQAKEEKKTKTCPYCFTDIAIKASRCPNCTSALKEQLPGD